MDDLDLLLIREVGAFPFQTWPHPPAASRLTRLAKKARVSVETVKRRFQALARSGVFAGREVWPNFRLFGLQASTYHFRLADASRKRDALARISQVPGILDAVDMVGPDVCIDVCHGDEEDLEARLAQIEAPMGTRARAAFFAYPLPEPTRQPTPLDWRIIQALRGRADRSLAEVARELRVSPRTVTRRFEALANEGAIDVVGNLNLKAIQGHVVVWLLFHMERSADASDVARVLNTFRGRWLAQWSPPDPNVANAVLVLVLRSAYEAESFRREAETLPHVGSVEALFLNDVHGGPPWVDQEIARRAQPTPRTSKVLAAPSRRA